MGEEIAFTAALDKRFRELTEKRARLERELAAVDELIAAVRLLQNNEDPHSIAAGASLAVTESEWPANFSAQVRHALAKLGRVASPTEVAGVLKAHGLGNGETELAGRTNVELWGMAKRKHGGVRRIGRGKYVIGE